MDNSYYGLGHLAFWTIGLATLLYTTLIPLFVGWDEIKKWWDQVKDDQRNGLQIALEGDNSKPAINLIIALHLYAFSAWMICDGIPWIFSTYFDSKVEPFSLSSKISLLLGQAPSNPIIFALGTGSILLLLNMFYFYWKDVNQKEADEEPSG